MTTPSTEAATIALTLQAQKPAAAQLASVGKGPTDSVDISTPPVGPSGQIAWHVKQNQQTWGATTHIVGIVLGSTTGSGAEVLAAFSFGAEGATESNPKPDVSLAATSAWGTASGTVGLPLVFLTKYGNWIADANVMNESLTYATRIFLYSTDVGLWMADSIFTAPAIAS